jgi:hypothetical protein
MGQLLRARKKEQVGKGASGPKRLAAEEDLARPRWSESRFSISGGALKSSLETSLLDRLPPPQLVLFSRPTNN